MQIAKDEQFTQLIDEATVDQTTFTSFDTTYPDGPIYWRVQAIDGSSNPLAWSDVGKFEKVSPKAELLAPVQGAAIDGSAAFRWDPTPYARSYDVEVYRNNDTTAQTANRVASVTGWKQTTWTPSVPLPQADSAYVWRARRADADNRKSDAGWSEWRSFEVERCPPKRVRRARPIRAGACSAGSTIRRRRQELPLQCIAHLGPAQSGRVTTSPRHHIRGSLCSDVDARGRHVVVERGLPRHRRQGPRNGDRQRFSRRHPTRQRPDRRARQVGTLLSRTSLNWDKPGVTSTNQWFRGG